MIHINELKVNYKDLVALDIKEEIYIEKGDKVGVIGSNGAGKSTLMKAILGRVPYQGYIHKEVGSDQIAIHSQHTAYIDHVPIKDIMEMILNKSIYEDEEIVQLLEYFDFEKCLKRKWMQLSGGEKQKMTLILVLSQNLPITILDEVTSGLDFLTRTNLMGLLKTWFTDKERTLLVISHYYDEIESLVNKILYLEEGKVIAFGKRKELFEKYCGYSVIIMEENLEILELIKGYRQILGLKDKVVISCRSKEEEQELITLLCNHNVNYRRSNQDIEVLTLAIKGERL